MDTRKLKFFVNIIVSPLALVMNGCLIYLIHWRSAKALQDYKKVLYLGVTVDVIYSSISLLFAPTTFVYKDVYFVLLEGILGQLEEPMTTIGYVLNAFATYFCIATAQVQFVYRYMLLFLTSVISCGICGFIGYLGSGILTTSADLVYYQSLVIFTGWPEVLTGKRNYAATRIKYVNFIFYPAAFVVLYSYMFIIFCGLSIRRALKKEVSKYTIQTIKCQTQVSVVLVIEAVVPVVTVVIPTIIDVLASYLSFYTPWLGPVRKTVICVAPLLNPILKISIVSCYRNTVLRYMGRKVENSSHSKSFTSDYKKVLYLGATVDIIYSIISLLFAPTTFVYNDVYFVILEGILGPLEEPMTTIGFILNAFSTYFCIATAQVQFIYRYLLICKDKKLNNLAFFGLVSTSIISCGMCGIIHYLAFQIRSTSEDSLYYQSLVEFTGWPEVLTGKRNYAATRIKYVKPTFFPAIFILLYSYISIIFCGISIHRTLKKGVPKYLKPNVNYQTQVSVVLMMEAVVPIITVVIPTIIDFVAGYLNLYTPWLGPARKTVTCVAPLFNPIMKICIVSCYKAT
ncbi:hypothetical protein FO519_007967, partial [Halicephalobus sp. NKZ332]